MLGWPGLHVEKMLPLYRCPLPVASACVVTVTFSSSAANTYELFSSDSTGRWSFPRSYTTTPYSSEEVPGTVIFESQVDVFLLLATTNTSWDELLLDHRIDRYPLAVEFSEKLQLMLIVPGLEQLVTAHAWASWVPKVQRSENFHMSFKHSQTEVFMWKWGCNMEVKIRLLTLDKFIDDTLSQKCGCAKLELEATIKRMQLV